MKYLKDSITGQFYAFPEDGSQDKFIRSGLISATADDVFNLFNPISVVPSVVTMRQARLALLGAGLLATVDSAVAAMPGTAGDAARIEWEFAATVDRNSPLVASLSAALNLSPAQLDSLFSAAAVL